MRELENTRLKIRDEDMAVFEAKITPIKERAVDAIISFGDLQKNLAEKFASNKATASKVGMYSCLRIYVWLFQTPS